jgi:outer membrane protein TolC
VTLTGGASLDRARATGDGKFDGGEAWDAGVRADFPWNRRKERNAFRKQLIALEQAKRGLEQQEDAIKQAVRAGRRNLVAARAAYVNQVEALKVAKLRVESNALFLQAGRSSMRDVLEAQKALLEARNALSSVLISWQMSDLELRRDMGVLEISDAGMWLEADGKDNG